MISLRQLSAVALIVAALSAHLTEASRSLRATAGSSSEDVPTPAGSKSFGFNDMTRHFPHPHGSEDGSRDIGRGHGHGRFPPRPRGRFPGPHDGSFDASFDGSHDGSFDGSFDGWKPWGSPRDFELFDHPDDDGPFPWGSNDGSLPEGSGSGDGPWRGHGGPRHGGRHHGRHPQPFGSLDGSFESEDFDGGSGSEHPHRRARFPHSNGSGPNEKMEDQDELIDLAPNTRGL